MKNTVKRACVFLTICCCTVFSFIGYGERALPEEIALTIQQPLVNQAPYSVEIVDANTEGAAKRNQTSGQAAAVDAANELRVAAFKLLDLFPVKSAKLSIAKRSYVIVGGEVFGIKLYTRGVLVAKTDLVSGARDTENPSQAAGIRAGDLITAIDGKTVERKKDVADAITRSGGKPLILRVERGGKPMDLTLKPVRAEDGKYLAGLWIRDSSAGIGTVTFYDASSNTIAGLGHAICDVDTGEIVPIAGGELVSARVMGCYKGTDGSPGELCGLFESDTLGTLGQNGAAGIYGELNSKPAGVVVPVAQRGEIKLGKAQIIATIDSDGPQTFDVQITKVSSNVNAQKNMTIKITDPKLIEVTGGIVQGMSGAPLMQNGMLAGAVTHVFVNNPLEGYAIFAQTMVETAQSVSDTRELVS
ncbi:MAG: SpoIVB peptidase [Oscillospiraceae bacterium]|jgi:stage IV sporulation protein B|nr:SpoIVB peptidase [Oscillospiraceae bacterium]